MELFTYGTLCIPIVIKRVLGRVPEHDEAHLQDYICRLVKSEVYPGIRPEPGQQTPGRVYRGIEDADLERLDAFEGGQYERRSVRICTPTGALTAWVYVIRPAYQGLLSSTPWEEEAFIQRHLPDFLGTDPGLE